MVEDSFSPEIQKRIDALPAAAREFVTSPEMGKAVQGIALKHRLHIDQTGTLEAEVLAAVIGISDFEDFAENLADVLSVDTQKSEDIAKDTNDLIFIKIREKMKSSSEKRDEKQVPSTPSAVQIPAPVFVAPPPSKDSNPSVVMPSSPKPAPTPVVPNMTPTSTSKTPSVPPITPKPALAPDLTAADAILSEKKVTPPTAASTTPTAPLATPAASPVPKVDPAQPQNYKADPYREPIQ